MSCLVAKADHHGTSRAVTRSIGVSEKARERGTRFGRKPLLIPETIQQVRRLRKTGKKVPEIMRQTDLSKASVYRALGADKASLVSINAT